MPAFSIGDATPALMPEGCALVGRMTGPLALYAGGMATSDIFATVYAISNGTLHFGLTPEQAPRLVLDAGGLLLDVAGDPRTVTVFLKRRLRYQEVFEPDPLTPMEARGHSKTEIEIKPHEWANVGVPHALFRDPKPWVASCTQIGLVGTSTLASTVPARATMSEAIGKKGGAIALSSRRAGPVIVDLPPTAVVREVGRVGTWSEVEWYGDYGVFRGFTPAAALDRDDYGTLGHGYGTGSGSRIQLRTSCAEELVLLVIRDGVHVWSVGTVPPHVAIRLGKPLRPLGGPAAGYFEVIDAGPQMNSGFTLAVANDPNLKCRMDQSKPPAGGTEARE